MSSSVTSYELYVIDNSETIIDQISTRSGKSDAKIETRLKIAPFIRTYFSDCPSLMAKVDKYDYPDERNESILGFFSDTRYINCK